MTNAERVRAWRLGTRAAQLGENNCPYPDGTDAAKKWQQAYDKVKSK